MNEKLPKPMLDALAHAATPVEHPPADVLAAYVERALEERETQSVVEHLFACSECREVVFLASGAAEEQGAERAEDLQVAALRREFHAESMPEAFMTRSFGAIPTRASEREAPQMKPLKRWWPRLVWAGSIAAVLVVAAGYFGTHWRTARSAAVQLASRPAQENQASNQVAEALPNETAPAKQPEAAAPKTRAKAPPSVASVKSAPLAGTLTMNSQVAVAPPPPTAANAEQKLELAKPGAAKSEVAIGGAMPAAPMTAPRASGFAPSTDEATRSLTGVGSGQFTGQKAAVNLLQSLHPGWRITAEGRLEHHTSEGWSPVLADQKNSFRVVGIIGSDVWAGGNGGMLFHSTDGGQTWKKVNVSGLGSAAVVSIRFDDLQNGVVTGDDGASYATSDGGATWARQ